MASVNLSIPTTEATSPIACLPDDILFELFHSLYNTILDHEGSLFPGFIRPSLHVCRRWRFVVLSTPTLWREVTVNAHPERLRFFLTHSADVPKIVRFKDAAALFPTSELSMLVPFLASIRILELSFDYLSPSTFARLWEYPLASLFFNA
ncbi:hypothetical protein C8Q73DRAFT_789491 [Cubamyces lactineus]|nr:hypothetical protein C8Q73DRAFT_789491 [Cubamyces lactineus]